MKTLIETIAVAFSMFTALPLPQIEWNEKNMRFCMAAFPLTGVLTGLLQAGWILLCARFTWPTLLLAAGVTAIPILVTGGIHLDGYMDVSDALSSYGDAVKKRAILADPHIGAFAVIRLAVLLILTFGFASMIRPKPVQMVLLGCSYVMSRSLSALAQTRFPLSKDTGLAHMFQSRADKKKTALILIVWIIGISCLMIGAGGVLNGLKGVLPAVLMIGCAFGQWFYLRHTADKHFGGLSGDLNGWFLQKAELWMLAALVLTKGVLG